MISFFKNYHKWVSIVLTIFILLFALSGIVLNHRQLFSTLDVDRNYLPSEYQLQNWNSASVKSTERIANDSILIYGNIGIWLCDSDLTFFKDFNKGFPNGADNHKIEKVFKSKNGNLFAGTLFGLFKYNYTTLEWEQSFSPDHNPRIVDIAERSDTLFVLSRSYLYKSIDYSNFTKHQLPHPVDYDNKIGLFKTLWVIHSGEVYGDIGKLFVDAMGLIFIFLSITGLVYFFVPFILKRKKSKADDRKKKLKRFNLWSLKWHNKIGWITLVFLLLTTFTGMFLRPPLLALIASSKVAKIPYTELDTPNPWFDKLRRIIIDESADRVFIASPEGVYETDINLSTKLKRNPYQPPISVMGVNVFEKIDEENLLVGSFEGLFVWNHKHGFVFDAIKQMPHKPDYNKRIPLGDFLVTGYSGDFNCGNVYFDFNHGAGTINNRYSFASMPTPIKNQNMSLWNVSLEVHTARMYQFMFGKFYILFVPLSGILIFFILISGFVVWYKRHRR